MMVGFIREPVNLKMAVYFSRKPGNYLKSTNLYVSLTEITWKSDQ
jgi:hypothetical protein